MTTPRPPVNQRLNQAAEAECVLCGTDAVRNVLLHATMLHENNFNHTTWNEAVCVPCVFKSQDLREKEFL